MAIIEAQFKRNAPGQARIRKEERRSRQRRRGNGMPFGPKKKAPNPVNVLREHVSTFLYWVKLGRTKFRGKKEIGPIFVEMESAKYLFEQATNGTVYDYQKKLERNVWAAAMHTYGEDLQRLKEAMLRAADACEAQKVIDSAAEESEDEAEARLEEEEAHLSLRERMKLAEARDAEEDARAEAAESAGPAPDGAAEMTEADCRELWEIYRHMNSEYRWMKKTADRWIEENPESGCLGMAAFLLAAPLAAVGALVHFL